MEQMEQFEPVDRKPGNNFWKGALCGALAALAVCALGIGVASLLIKKGSTPIVSEEGKESSIISDETIQKLEEIQGYIDTYFFYLDDVDNQAIQDAIIKGYVNGFNDPYTVYYDAEETAALYESTSGTFSGIGVVVQQDTTTGLVKFVKIYEEGPGQAAGFKAGDLVYKVDGEDMTGLDMDTVVSKIRGEIGTEVEITVLRGDNLEEYTATAIRAQIETHTVEYEMKEGKIGYISVSNFEQVTTKQFEAALDDLNDQGMKGLIIDLRNNTGGLLDVVCDMVDLIMGEGTIVSIKDKNGNGEVHTSDKDCKLNVPLVVLTNGYSASASEIFAGAVKDHELGTLVGTTTFGKGIVQNIYMLNDGTAFKFTSSEYFTPNGDNIHGVGITPDIEIEYEYDAENPDYDNQLEKAIEVLKSGM